MSNLVILQHSSWPETKLLEFLHAKGFSTQPTLSPDGMLPIAQSAKSPMLLVHSGDSVDSQTEVCRCLLKETELHKYPLVLVGLKNVNLESALGEVFSLAEFVQDEKDDKAIFEALSLLRAQYDPEYSHATARVDSEKEMLRSTTILERAEFEAFPEFLFAQLEKLSHAEDLGGARMLNLLSLNELSHLEMVPDDSKTREMILDVFRELRGGSRTHVARVAYMSAQLLKAMNISPSMYESSKSAALLYPTAFTRSLASLHRVYLPLGSSENKILMERLQESAQLFAAEVNDEIAQALIYGMASLIGEGRFEGPEEMQIAVSTLVASDLVHRICFKSGVWNPQGVYSLMTKLKSDKLPELHPSVLAAAIKYVNEAAFARNLGLEVKNPLLPEKERIPLVQLQPGMRLGSPILDGQGETVLEEGLVLDEDLIWRVWQLLALKVLTSELEIS